jgi:hypothetical protein
VGKARVDRGYPLRSLRQVTSRRHGASTPSLYRTLRAVGTRPAAGKLFQHTSSGCVPVWPRIGRMPDLGRRLRHATVPSISVLADVGSSAEEPMVLGLSGPVLYTARCPRRNGDWNGMCSRIWSGFRLWRPGRRTCGLASVYFVVGFPGNAFAYVRSTSSRPKRQ